MFRNESKTKTKYEPKKFTIRISNVLSQQKFVLIKTSIVFVYRELLQNVFKTFSRRL